MGEMKKATITLSHKNKKASYSTLIQGCTFVHFLSESTHLCPSEGSGGFRGPALSFREKN